MTCPKSLAAIAVAALLTTTAVIAENNQPATDKSAAASRSEGKNASNEMHKVMQEGSKEMTSMRMTGDADHDFATMMRKHHNDAVVMSEKELKDGRDPEMKSMAQKIIAAQKKEIDELDKWLANHKPSASGEKK